MPYVCDGSSAGVLAVDRDGRVLLGERAKPPEGIAPPCGHVTDVDPDRSHRQAAVDETWEEYGLTVRLEDLELVYSRWHPNRCGATIPAQHRGHQWQVYRAFQWAGEVAIALDEVRSFGWYSPGQVQYLADRTIAYAHGYLPQQEWQDAPGLEPIWVDILAQTPKAPDDLLDTYIQVLDPVDLRAVRDLYKAAPAR